MLGALPALAQQHALTFLHRGEVGRAAVLGEQLLDHAELGVGIGGEGLRDCEGLGQQIVGGREHVDEAGLVGLGRRVEAAREAGLGSRCVIGAFAPEVIGKKGYEYIMGKESGVRVVKIYLDRLGLQATEEQMRKMQEIVKEESNIIKGTISEGEFEFIAKRVLQSK
mgnify:CR=1 FL=1